MTWLVSHKGLAHRFRVLPALGYTRAVCAFLMRTDALDPPEQATEAHRRCPRCEAELAVQARRTRARTRKAHRKTLAYQGIYAPKRTPLWEESHWLKRGEGGAFAKRVP